MCLEIKYCIENIVISVYKALIDKKGPSLLFYDVIIFLMKNIKTGNIEKINEEHTV